MSKKINLGLIQDKYTNLILYDESTRCDNSIEWIGIPSIQSIDVTFKKTSSFLSTDHIFRFTKNRKVVIVPYGDFIPFNGSDYNNSKYMLINVNGIDYNITCNVDIHNAQEMVDFLNANLSVPLLHIWKEGERIFMEFHNQTVKILEGSLLEYLCYNKGVYRPNDFRWNDNSVTQEEFKFYINADSIDLLDELPEGYLDVSVVVTYRKTLTIDVVYISEWTEFLYMQTEIYRAKMFEYIANNFTEFLQVEQRYQTDFEIFMQKSVYFDSLYKAFLSSIEVGNKERSYELLKYLIDYKTLNPFI